MIARMRTPGHAGALLLSLTAALGATLATPPARGQDVRDILRLVATDARSTTPLRADGRIVREGADPVDVVLLARGDRVYLETRDGTRALIRPGRAVIREDGGLVRATPDAPLPGTDLLLLDLAPFTRGAIAHPQISDDGPAGVVVTGAPALPSAYVLLVQTIDPEHPVIVRTKYYRDDVTNLVKMRRDGELIEVAGRWRPGRIAVEAFRPPNTTTITLAWREAADAPPAAFTLKGLRQPSPVAFATR